MLKITRWWRLPPEYDPTCCEGPELECYVTSDGEYHGTGCSGDVEIGCETDNGSEFKLCPDCSRVLGFKNAVGR